MAGGNATYAWRCSLLPGEKINLSFGSIIKLSMKLINLKKTLIKYKSGWVAIDKKFKVVDHAPTFKALADKYRQKTNFVLMPASADYSGLVTRLNA